MPFRIPSSIVGEQFSNIVKNTNAQCKVVIYPWKFGLGNPDLSDRLLGEATRLDISSQLRHCTFSKNMGSPAGTFSWELTSSPGIGTQDWKDIIKRGYWALVYMSNDGSLKMNPNVGRNLAKNRRAEAKYIRAICYVEAVGVKGSTQENKSIDFGYEVSGRDFGIVYEETNIWHNLFKYDKIMLTSVRDSQMNVVSNTRLDKVIKLIHDLFYFPANIPGAQVDNHKSLLDIGLQWLLPKEMLQDLGFSLTKLQKGTYWGNIPGAADLSSNGGDIHQTGFGIAVDRPTDYLSGNAWEQLKRLAIPQFHELFAETRDNGTPRLVFRPIPWGINQKKYPKNRKYITKYLNLTPIATVPGSDLLDNDLKEDEHSRYNSFLVTTSTSLINNEDNVTPLSQTDFPRHNRASIRRHGFRPMHVTVDSIINNAQLGNGGADFTQLVEANEIMYDYWNNAVFAECGQIVKIGSNDIKIGKVLKFGNDVPYMVNKRYYIEGYVDTYILDDNAGAVWTQEVMLTRGFDEKSLRAGTGFGSRKTEFTAPGEYTKRNSSGDT